MKVIFVDFDGVLYGIHDIFRNGVKVPESKWLERLNKSIRILSDICSENDAKIVIESAYKDLIDEDTLETDVDWVKRILESMKDQNIEVIGRTPNLESFKENYDGNPPIWKEDEILEYLRRHPEIDNYCVIDDDDLVTIPAKKEGDYSRSDLNKVRDHLVTTEYINLDNPEEEGLQEYHKEEVKRVFQKKRKVL